MNIYLVVGEKGSHDDYETWIAAAFLDKDKADAECARLMEAGNPSREKEKRLRQLKHERGYWSLTVDAQARKEVGWTYDDYTLSDSRYEVKLQEVQE